MKNWKQFVIGFGIAFAALYYTLHNVSMDELAASFKTVDYIYLIPSVLIMIMSYVMRIFRWQVLISPMKTVDRSVLYSPMMVGFLANILPARAGEFVRAYLLGKKIDLSFSGAFASIVVERLFDLIMLLLIFAWVFVFHKDVFPAELRFSGISVQALAMKFGQFSTIMVATIMVFIYFLVYHKERMLGWARWITRPLPEKWREKIEYLLEEFDLGLQVVKDVPSLAKVTFYSTLVWGAIVLSYYPLYFAYDLQDKSLQSLLILTVMVCILITVLPTPAFLGSFNAGVLIALHNIMGETELTAVSFSMVVWTMNFMVIFVTGVYFILHDHLSVRQLVEVEEQTEEIPS